MNKQWDVIVVGAGPAGSTLARYAAANGASVLVLEKDRDVGMPVRCGEAVSNRSLEKIVSVDKRWIATTIKRFRLISPSGYIVEPDLGGYGYILNRRLFDYDLAGLAAQEGAEIRTKCYVSGLIPGEHERKGVFYEWQGKVCKEFGRIIVGADGVESRVGKWAGIDTTTHIRDMESCAQMTLANIDPEEDVCEFYFGASIAPMGYLWIFPKGRRTANVGVGISGTASKKRHAIRYLQDFISLRYPTASILSTIAGGVPCVTTVEPLIKDNVLLVGDAAHQVNPMSGGGITSGMIAGKIAGEVIGEALHHDNLTYLSKYPERWEQETGNKHRTYYRIKNAVHTLTDEALDAIASGVLQLPPEKHTIWRVFGTALRRHPSLVWEMMRVLRR